MDTALTTAVALLIAAHVWGVPSWCGQQPAIAPTPAPQLRADCTLYVDPRARGAARCTAIVREWGIVLHQQLPGDGTYWRCTTKRGIHGFTARQWHSKPAVWYLQ